MPDEWFEIVEGNSLLQGDLIRDCPIIQAPDDLPLDADGKVAQQVTLNAAHYDVVVMSQSCDLENQKIDYVLACPVLGIDEFSANEETYKSAKAKEHIRKGLIPGCHMLAASTLEGLEAGIRIVDFHNVFGVPLGFLRRFAAKQGKRARLRSPYREHLSQAFARFFMRVGLPSDIPKFT